ncbi:PepSY-associated TM helix domain-containing protein [Actinoplanes sp. NPDC051859]|uniref:PepSY-associated TM helix domain-containing protein n=1 Tax=Actinoplanes sp. NPDC051859 TaxID=3363909 RepID=UPI003794BD48
MTTTAAPSSAPPVEQRRPRTTGGFSALLLRLHFYAGILVAPFLLVAALTGLAYVFAPQVERIIYADELVVANPGDQTVPVAQQIAAARATHPQGALLSLRPGEGEATTQIDFSSPELDEEHQHTVYVDPYTGTATGQLTTWFATTPFTTWLDDLHRNLHLGDTGRHYSELAASWLWVITLGGLILWWQRQRGKRTARRMLTPDLSAKKGVRRTRGWHAATGVWLTIGLLVLSATGLTWSRYAGENFGLAVDALKGSRPSVSTTIGGPAEPATGGHHGGATTPAEGDGVDPAVVDSVLKVARDNGISGPVAITVPEDAATAWTVQQNRAQWPVARDNIAVDAATGTVVDQVKFADWPVMAKLTQWGIYAHMGSLFGLTNQILLAALAIGLICVIVWGYRMWWQRRPTRADRRALVGAPPARGAWQGLPAWGIAVGVPVVFAVGWALPLFGIPLAAFLLFDAVIGAIRSRRKDEAVPVSPAPAGG